jgi:hypothetical protein
MSNAPQARRARNFTSGLGYHDDHTEAAAAYSKHLLAIAKIANIANIQ